MNRYYDSLLAFLRHAVEQGFLKAKDHDLLLVNGSLPKLLEAMEAFQPIIESVPAKLAQAAH